MLDCNGRHLYPRDAVWSANDEPAARSALAALDAERGFSNSNPVPGILQAFATAGPEPFATRLIVLAVGDEFTGTRQSAMARIAAANPRGPDGRRPAVIDAIFVPTWRLLGPTMPTGPGATHEKFAQLMRELAATHGGA